MISIIVCHSKCIVSVIMYRMSYLLITNVQSNMPIASTCVVAIRTFISFECMVSTFEGSIVKINECSNHLFQNQSNNLFIS